MIPLPLPDALGIASSDWMLGTLYMTTSALFDVCAGGALGLAVLLLAHRLAPQHEILPPIICARIARIILPLILIAVALSLGIRVLDIARWGNLVLVAAARGGILTIAAAIAVPVALAAAAQLSFRPDACAGSRGIAAPLLLFATLIFGITVAIGIETTMEDPGHWHAGAWASSLALTLAGSIAIASMIMLIGGNDAGEELIRRGMRILAAAATVTLCILPLRIHTVDPAAREFFLVAGTGLYTLSITALLTLSLVCTSLLGIMRPRNPVWFRAAATELIACVVAYRFMSYAIRTAETRAFFSTADLAIHRDPLMTTALVLVIFATAAAAALMGMVLINLDRRYQQPL